MNMDTCPKTQKPAVRGVTLRPQNNFEGIIRMSEIMPNPAHGDLVGYWVETYHWGETAIYSKFVSFKDVWTAIGSRSVESEHWNEQGFLVVLDPLAEDE